MGWKLSTEQRIRAGGALIIVFLLILATNMIDNHHFTVVKKSITSIYEDRLMAKNYIYRISRHLETKRNILQTGKWEEASNINALANDSIRTLIEKYGSKVPKTFDELEELPGVGHKTASVVMSQGFGYPAFPVDTHIHRLAQRWGLTNGKNVVQTEMDLKSIFPKQYWNKLHLQIIWYGREYCKARECYGITCKICKSCYPNRKKPIKTKKA